MPLDPVIARIDADLPTALDRLMELLRIPSISADPAYKRECDAAADWLVADLKSIGVKAEKRPAPGHPMAVGHVGDCGPHLLFYGHYDVQPVDPLDQWETPPFEPEIQDTPKGRVIRGRGASDDKGQLMTFVEACRAWMAVHGSLPCRTALSPRAAQIDVVLHPIHRHKERHEPRLSGVERNRTWRAKIKG